MTCVLLSAFASRAEEVPVPGAVIDLRFTSEAPEALQKVARHWVERAAQAVIAYHGKFPAPRTQVRISVRRGHGVSGGTTYGWNGLLTTVTLGRDTVDADLADDWLMTHEFLHLAFPSVAEEHHWIEEGLSTYVEPIARARAGQLKPERVWRDLVEGLPQGQPESNDQGLDHTHTWGRTYWGGALFCLRADVEIRKRTSNRRGLEDALRAIVASGGTIDHDWTMEQVINTGDRATGVPVLRELYNEMKDRPVTVDLTQLWRQLGVELKGGRAVFHDDAPLAAVRKAIAGA